MPPDIFHRDIFAALLGKRLQGRKGKNGKFEREEVEFFYIYFF